MQGVAFFIVRLDVVNLSVVTLTVVAPIGKIVLPLKKKSLQVVIANIDTKIQR
jgi:hypothetical protein